MKNIRVRKIGAKVKKYRLRRKKFAPIKKNMRKKIFMNLIELDIFSK